MKNHTIKIRVSERRLNKLRLYSVWTDKTMTAVLEELIDSLPIPPHGKNSNALHSVVAMQQDE